MSGLILIKKKKQKAIERIRKNEIELENRFMEIGEDLNFIISDVTNKEEFEEIVNENFKMSIQTAYAIIRVWKNRDYLDLKEYGFWKAHEIVKISDQEERREFEKKYEPETKPIREVREDIRTFRASKGDYQESEFCIRFMRKVREAKRDLSNLRVNVNELKGMFKALQIAHKDEWNNFAARERIKEEFDEIIKSVK